jgi:hypothetical protein
LEKSADLAAILAVLARHDVEFVLIGGLAASLHGCPIPTFDVDVVYHLDDQNLTRLEAALQELRAEFALDLARRHLVPTRSHLSTTGPKLLTTRYGRLDVLGQVNEHISWEELLRDSTLIELGGAPVRVVKLDRLIAIKEWLVSQDLPERRGRDQTHLHYLRAIRERRAR